VILVIGQPAQVGTECTAKYGRVTGVVIFEVTQPGFPPELAVRIFVAFERQEDATKVPRSGFSLTPTLDLTLTQTSLHRALHLSGRNWSGPRSCMKAMGCYVLSCAIRGICDCR